MAGEVYGPFSCGPGCNLGPVANGTQQPNDTVLDVVLLYQIAIAQGEWESGNRSFDPGDVIVLKSGDLKVGFYLTWSLSILPCTNCFPSITPTGSLPAPGAPGGGSYHWGGNVRWSCVEAFVDGVSQGEHCFIETIDS